MNKSLVLTSFALLTSVAANAQIAKWIIEPNFESISVKVDNQILATDSAGYTTLWSMDGKRLFTTSEEIQPFCDDVATVINKSNGTIQGFVDLKGKFTPLPNLQPVYDNPNFNSGFLLCKEGDSFVFYNKEGQKASLPKTARQFPFKDGYAAYFTYENLDKKKDPHFGYMTPDGPVQSFKIVTPGEEKFVDPKEISFASSLIPGGNGVVIIKDKVYWFKPGTNTLEPMQYGNEESLKKRHLNLTNNLEQYFNNLPNDTISIDTKFGKKQYAVLVFDNKLNPAQFNVNGELLFFEEPAQPKFDYETSLSTFIENNLIGIECDGYMALPAQFTETGLMFDNRFMAQYNNKWGVIELFPDLDTDIMINKGEVIDFRHENFYTQIRLDLPAEVSADNVTLDIPYDTGCNIDKPSRQTRNTPEGNYVSYDCTLTIPKELPDTESEIVYQPFSTYNAGIKYLDKWVKVNAWHSKYYNVDPIDERELVIDYSKNSMEFFINITVDRIGDERTYPFTVTIAADSVHQEKISDTRYKCYVYNLKEGDNTMDISITEKGCPPAVFPFTINYTKPVPKKKEQGKVTIQKRKPEQKKPENPDFPI